MYAAISNKNDHKSILNQLCQQQHQPRPEYIASEEGDWGWFASCTAFGIIRESDVDGYFKRRKDAEQSAAYMMLLETDNVITVPPAAKTVPPPPPSSSSSQSPTTLLLVDLDNSPQILNRFSHSNGVIIHGFCGPRYVIPQALPDTVTIHRAQTPLKEAADHYITFFAGRLSTTTSTDEYFCIYVISTDYALANTVEFLKECGYQAKYVANCDDLVGENFENVKTQ